MNDQVFKARSRDPADSGCCNIIIESNGTDRMSWEPNRMLKILAGTSRDVEDSARPVSKDTDCCNSRVKIVIVEIELCDWV